LSSHNLMRRWQVVYEALWAQGSVAAAANELSCSQGYIFKVLKANGLKLKDVFKG
jgi:hypothetical protein